MNSECPAYFSLMLTKFYFQYDAMTSPAHQNQTSKNQKRKKESIKSQKIYEKKGIYFILDLQYEMRYSDLKSTFEIFKKKTLNIGSFMLFYIKRIHKRIYLQYTY